jgi:membrane protein DedA with SNARE-associated domain
MELVESLVERIVELPLWAAWVVIVVATFVSEDLTCVAAGLAAATGNISAYDAIGAAGLGIWIGDLGLYAAGKFIGKPALRRAPFKWFIHDEDVHASSDWFAQRGSIVILLGRFVPGTRLPTYFAAGLLETGFWSFSAWALLAVAIWAPLLGGGAMLIGRQILPWIETYESWALVWLFAAVFAYFSAVKFLIPAFTWRGRRMIVSRWRRMTQWEFWPPWLFYPPVLAHVAWLALRHRSLSVLTAVNPGIPAGGFIGESKQQIVESLGDSEFVVRSRLLSASQPLELRLGELREFLEAHALDYPIVLKPDAGQRGSGVAIVRDSGEARDYLESIRVDCVVQEYAPGDEFGVFYYRFPDAERGRIFSITRKVFPTVRGDGERTLEDLILADPRAVCMAKFYLKQNTARLHYVPRPGEAVQLVEIGNHCRGAIFLDGTALATPELEAAIERISRRFEGFYFGRYDIRVRSEADLRAGEGLKVIELNGATAEATHIYDPRYSLFDAYRTLREQWTILFAIASANRSRGAPTTSIGDLLHALTAYRRAAKSHPR